MLILACGCHRSVTRSKTWNSQPKCELLFDATITCSLLLYASCLNCTFRPRSVATILGTVIILIAAEKLTVITTNSLSGI